MSDRQKKRIARMRRDPGGRFSLEVTRYLNSHGWSVLMTTGASIHGTGKKQAFDLCIGFVGSRRAVAAEATTEQSGRDRRELLAK